MLIQLAARAPESQAMRPDFKSDVLIPGEQPPLVSPHCRKCRIPVERFTLDYISSPYYLSIQAQCHGSTTGQRIPHDEAIVKSRTGGVIWMFNG